MLRTLSLVGVAILLCSSMSLGGTIVQTDTFTGVPDLTRTLTFAEFDTLGGTRTLLSIEVLVSLSVGGGQLILDNDGEGPASGTFKFGAKGNISSSDVALVKAPLLQPVTAEVQAGHTDTFSLATNVGDGLLDYDPTAPDGMAYNGGVEGDLDSGFISPTVFAQYIGSSTYDISVDVDQWQDFGGVSGIEWAVSPVTSSGSVTVIYNFIPEPATMVMLALGGLAFIRRKR